MPVVLLVSRLVLASVFAVSGTAKLADPSGTRRAITGFGFADRLARVGTWILPAGELAVVALLLPSSTAWWGGLGTLALLVVFEVGIAVNLRRGRAPDCHCFGQLHSEPISARTLVRNAVLALPALAVLVLGWTDAGPSAVAWIEDLDGSEAILAGTTAALAVALIGVVLVMRRLVVRQRELTESVRVMERLFDERDEQHFAGLAAAAQTPYGLPIGAVAPDAVLSDQDGGHVTLGSLIVGQPAVAMLFVSANCAPCRELLSKVPGWRREWSARLRFVVVAPGSREANAKLVADHPDIDLLFADDEPVAAAFRAQWTPAAVVVTAKGRIASETTFGVADIESLLADAAADHSRLLPAGSKVGAPAPAFAAVDDHGESVTHQVFAGRSTALVYWDPTCGYCAALAEELAAWANDPPLGAPRLMLLTQKIAPLPDRFGAERVLVDPGGEIVQAFGFVGTPSAIIIDEDGTIASSTCVGADDVKAVLGASVRRV